MTETLYTATSEYVEEIKALPVKRQVSVSGILKKLDVSRSGYHACVFLKKLWEIICVKWESKPSG